MANLENEENVYYYSEDTSLSSDKKEYIEYLDEVHCYGYGVGFEASDPIGFEIGFQEWLRSEGRLD